MNHRKILTMTPRKSVLCLFFLLIAAKCHANGISAVMGLTGVHLWFGNALIGLIEGLLIGIIFRVGKAKSAMVMVLANYFSMGLTLLWSFNYTKIDLNNALHWAYIVPVVCFISTLILEYPFCLFVLRRLPKRYVKSVIVTLLANAVSYSLLIPIYYNASDHSLYRLTKIDQQVVNQCKLPVTVYFIAPNEYALYQIGIDGTNMKKVTNTPSYDDGFMRGLFAQPSLAQDGHWEIWVQGWKKDQGNRNVKLLDLPAGCIASDWGYRYNPMKDQVWSFDPKESVPLTIDGKSNLSVRAWRTRWGLFIEDKDAKNETKLNFESPFMAFHSSSPTLLPDKMVVYQLADQIVLLDLNRMKIGLIEKGGYPIVAFDVKQYVQTSKGVAPLARR